MRALESAPNPNPNPNPKPESTAWRRPCHFWKPGKGADPGLARVSKLGSDLGGGGGGGEFLGPKAV